MPVGRMLCGALHEGHDDLPGLPGLAGRSPFQGSRVDAACGQAIDDEITHRRATLADANGARTGERIIFFGLHGSLKTLDRADFHSVFGRNLLRSCASAQEGLNVTRSEGRASGSKLHPRTVAARRTAELVRDQHRIAFTLGIGEHQGLAIGAGPEQFELNHHFLLKRLGRIVSNNAKNVA